MKAAVEGPVSAICPASALQLHRRATIVLDPEAASRLELTEYYHRVHPRRHRGAAVSAWTRVEPGGGSARAPGRLARIRACLSPVNPAPTSAARVMPVAPVDRRAGRRHRRPRRSAG